MNFAALGNFLELNSFVLVIFGTIAALVASFPFRIIKMVPKHLKLAFLGQKQDPLIYIDVIAEYAQMARKSGLLALEDKANQESDEFLKSCVLLIVDAMDADKIRQLVESDLEKLCVRHEEAVSLYDRGAALSPAFGMIGTVIGLINMLKAMGEGVGGPDELGAGMSLALITTLYGSIFANVIYTPISSKLKLQHEAELLCKEIILEGVLSIQSGENPKLIKEKLASMLEQSKRNPEQANKSKKKAAAQPAE